ncbi:MAG: carboxymuconolactone decarboxylase family protein [Dehalococcoidales bacterium]|nr:carboxymuconolactone decarboxylase family protein [Dehalococcoidales bacterium]
MARVKYVEKADAHPQVKDLYDKIEERGQKVIKLWKVMGHLPYIGLNYQRMGNSILKGEELPPKLREIAIIRLGYIDRSKYEFTQHTRIGLRVGLTQKQIDDIGDWQKSKAYSEEERAVLAYTDEVEKNIQVKDETFANLKKHLNEHQIVELTAAIGFYGMTCRILEALQVDMED